MGRITDPLDNGTFRDNLKPILKEMQLKNDMALLRTASVYDIISPEEFIGWWKNMLKIRFGDEFVKEE